MEPLNQINIVPESKKSHKVLWSLSLVLILVVVAGGGYLWTLNKQFEEKIETPVQNTPEVPSDETADWKTFTDYYDKFNIMYPPEWGDDSVFASSQEGTWIIQSTPIKNDSSGGPELPSSGNVWVTIIQGTCKNSTIDFVSEISKPGILEKTVCLDGYQITLGFWNNDPNKSEQENLLNKILSTFKFIDPVDVSIWKTYTSEYGFEINYPKDWMAEEVTLTYDGGPELMIAFEAPTADPQWIKSKYAPVFHIKISPIKEYEEDKKRCVEIQKDAYKFPSCLRLENLLGKNSQYVFIFINPAHVIGGMNLVPKDFIASTYELASSSGKSFKLVDLPKYDISTWKTYTNTKWGYEFKYPDNIGIVSDRNSSLLSPLENSKNDELLITDRQRSFYFQISRGKHYISDSSYLLDQILLTFKFLDMNASANSPWETYRNDEYGFEFKYPGNWILDLSNGIELWNHETVISYKYCYEFCTADISLKLTDIKDLDQYVSTYGNLLMKEVKKTEFLGYKSYEYIDYEFDYFSILLEKEKKVYEISFLNDYSKSNLNETENQILSTFKFTK